MKTKFAIGCLVQWYECDIIEEYVNLFNICDTPVRTNVFLNILSEDCILVLMNRLI